MATSSAGSDASTLKDNYVPLFSGAPGDYREWRKRINLYMAKMKLTKREAEGVLNLMTSLTGTAWKIIESFPVEEVEKPDAFAKLLKLLDKAFEYDNRVQLPGDFETLTATSVDFSDLQVRRFWITAPSTTSSTIDWLITK
eukprot:s702_g15.t1